ncbi:hypothetical protein K435DRAFT_775961 [Dendrothele bispora CBS 962.96]|uniref:Uncharacterized protein n=1 Tax=Dendrothele bispora (strain CBS 962.96) TaxID=1314807 RepID=A0A4S8MG83_DENBC|nr:hypothetical protein K435DRAFT_775961 [Dendrothele bispora CBS 962.96]
MQNLFNSISFLLFSAAPSLFPLTLIQNCPVNRWNTVCLLFSNIMLIDLQEHSYNRESF